MCVRAYVRMCVCVFFKVHDLPFVARAPRVQFYLAVAARVPHALPPVHTHARRHTETGSEKEAAARAVCVCMCVCVSEFRCWAALLGFCRQGASTVCSVAGATVYPVPLKKRAEGIG